MALDVPPFDTQREAAIGDIHEAIGDVHEAVSVRTWRCVVFTGALPGPLRRLFPTS